MGMTTGLALAGAVPVSIFPRWNFLLCAMSQLVNHLDKLQAMSNGRYPRQGDRPHRHRLGAAAASAAAARRRLHRGAARDVHDARDHPRRRARADIFPAYERALLRDDGRSTLVVEHGDFYGEK